MNLIQLQGLAGIDGKINAASAKSENQCRRYLTKDRPVTAAGSLGAINAWFDGASWRGERMVFGRVTREINTSSKSELIEWYGRQLKLI